MSWLVQPRLVNGPFDDPGAILDFRFGRRAILFDLGDVGALSSRELLRVSHAFVSHTHMDHFAGCDRLLRLCLHREAPLHLIGPTGFIDRVEHRLRSYTWNLLGPDSADFRLHVAEFEEGRIARAAAFRARAAFAREEGCAAPPPPGLALDEEEFHVAATELDHGVPCLAFALRERLRVNVRRGALDRLGLPVGPWLAEAKRAARLGFADETAIAVPGHAAIRLGALRDEVLQVGPGQVVAYVTDAAIHEANADRIVALARGADQLFIEAPFLERDRALALDKHHLTAAEAGRLAARAGVRHMALFHHSARYLDDGAALRAEAEAAFAAGDRVKAAPVAGAPRLLGLPRSEG